MTSYRLGRKPLHDYLRQRARETPHKTAIVWYGRRIGFGELDALSDRFAQCLHERGVGQGDVVVLCLQNCPQFLVAHLGAQKLGAIVSACHPNAKAYELDHQVRELGAVVLVAGDELMPVVQEAGVAPRLRQVYAVDYGRLLPRVIAIDVPNEVRLPGERRPARPDWAQDFDDALDACGPLALRPLIDLDDVALMAYTSGSTGLPKGAMLSHEAALYKTAVSADAFGLRAQDVMLADTALHHIAGLITGLALPLYTGATLVLLNRYDATAVLQAIEHCGVSWWYTMAPGLPSAMAADEAASYDLGSLHTTVATSFGVQLTETLAAQWSRFANGCLVYEAGYGLSESHTCDTIMPREAIRWGTNGKPAPGVELRIVDPDSGVDLPAGQRGEILLRQPVRFKGYWNRPEATAEFLRDGWMRTGDIGVVDEDGYLSFVGRRKEMIKVWSHSVVPEEVEAILATHPDVLQVAVVGCPDPNRGEALCAHVVLRPAVAAQARGQGGARLLQERIIAWCQQHMAHYKVPRSVVVRDALPTTEAGKVLRRLLREASAQTLP